MYYLVYSDDEDTRNVSYEEHADEAALIRRINDLSRGAAALKKQFIFVCLKGHQVYAIPKPGLEGDPQLYTGLRKVQ